MKYIQFPRTKNIYQVEGNLITKCLYHHVGKGLALPEYYDLIKLYPHKILSKKELEDFLLRAL